MAKKNKEKKKPIAIIAEGDSWFRYPIGKAVIFQLEQQLKTKILNLAAPGDEVREMLSLKQRRKVVKLFLEDFDNLLDRIALMHSRVKIVQTQGTLKDDEWANEIHPKNRGFKKIANLFKKEIKDLK